MNNNKDNNNNKNDNVITAEMAESAIATVSKQLDSEGLEQLDIFLTFAMSKCTEQVVSRIQAMAEETADRT